MGGALHADRLREGIDPVQPNQVGDGAGAGVVANDDHHHHRVAKCNREPWQQVLEAARHVVLVLLLNRHRLVEGELAVVDRFHVRHHDGDLAGAG